MSDGQLALVVCVSPDRDVRERLLRRLGDLGPLVLCSDLAELRAMLFPEAIASTPPVPDQPVPPPSAPPLLVDPDGHLVTWRGRPLALSRLERQLLARLASPPVQVWTYERLFSSVWGGAYLGDTAILHSAVKRLRRRLRAVEDGPRVQTVRGVGYRITINDLSTSDYR